MRNLHLNSSSYKAYMCSIFYLFVFSQVHNSLWFGVCAYSVGIVCACAYFSLYEKVSISSKLH